MESNRLLGLAGNYVLPTPESHADPDNRNWRQGTSFKPTRYLKPRAIQDLRMLIRGAESPSRACCRVDQDQWRSWRRGIPR